MVTTEGFVGPKFNPLQDNAEAGPERRPRHFANSEAQRGFGHFRLQLKITLHRARLFRSPCADLAETRARRKVRVGLLVAHNLGAASYAPLPVQRHPIKAESDARIAPQGLPFRAV